MKKSELHPAHPERVCWGCEKHCPADDLACGNGTERTLHPLELFGEDWLEWAQRDAAATAPHPLPDGEAEAAEQAGSARDDRAPESNAPQHSANAPLRSRARSM
ncbi:MAG TPA: DUF3079 domain-containing protein [Polyangiaceae bacterium]|nr:DUF3079 domain-containing protein [Polyangiaceae bacterium]